MQLDSTHSFREIYESTEAFLAGVRDIEQFMVAKPAGNLPLNLRFLTPRRPLESWTAETGFADYDLTASAVYSPSNEFVAVSYTWDYEQDPHGLSTMPDYRIWDLTAPGLPPRPLKCPQLVFHRAFRFARARNCRYVWIDQECINQEDPSDVERHLQIMDRIYSESRWTVATLSSGLSDYTTLNDYAQMISLASTRSGASNLTELLAKHVGPLIHISKDRWFSRTWTFHEKHCASSLDLLIPINPDLIIPDSLQPNCIGNDYCFNVGKVHNAAIPATFRHVANHGRLFLPRSAQPSDISPNGNEKILLYAHMFGWMESCKNSIVTDRFAMMANICKMQTRLRSTALATSKYSYSACMLALLMNNLWPGESERIQMYTDLAARIMNGTIVEAIHLLCNTQGFPLDSDSHDPKSLRDSFRQIPHSVKSRRTQSFDADVSSPRSYS